jgi:hypothetical protein
MRLPMSMATQQQLLALAYLLKSATLWVALEFIGV